MALVDHLSQQPVPKHGHPCSVGVLLDTLEGAERDALVTMLGTQEVRGWPAPAIWNACKAEGHTLGLQSINRHRGGKCRCFRDAA